jgi:hypothetical protein
MRPLQPQPHLPPRGRGSSSVLALVESSASGWGRARTCRRTTPPAFCLPRAFGKSAPPATSPAVLWDLCADPALGAAAGLAGSRAEGGWAARPTCLRFITCASNPVIARRRASTTAQQPPAPRHSPGRPVDGPLDTGEGPNSGNKLAPVCCELRPQPNRPPHAPCAAAHAHSMRLSPSPSPALSAALIVLVDLVHR